MNFDTQLNHQVFKSYYLNISFNILDLFLNQKKPLTYSPLLKRLSSTTNELLYKKYFDKVFNELSLIPKLWDSLGVTFEYKFHFVNVVMDLDISIRQEFFDYEVKNLTSLNDNLKVINIFTRRLYQI